jgi:hypothetical protein
MDEYIQNDKISEQKKKQEYLIKHIIKGNYDPHSFSEFLDLQKIDGQNIDNWNLEELETMVALFKRTYPFNEHDVVYQYKLEDIELFDDERIVYVKRITTPLKQKTTTFDSQIYILISNVDIIDGGIFYGKSLCFHIEIPQIDKNIRRTDAEFRWLQESLGKEFPLIPLPPLLKISDRYHEEGVLMQYKKFYEKFLNECAQHPEIKNSFAFDVFLKCQSKEDLTLRMKEVAKYYQKNILIDKNFTKKAFDYISKDVLEENPTNNGFIDIKISQNLKRHFASIDGQYSQYDVIFEKIQNLSIEYQKHYVKLITVNREIKNSFLELQNIAIRHNSLKEVKLKPNLVEDAVFSSLSTYFDNYGKITRENFRRSEKHSIFQHWRLFQIHSRIPQ